MLPFFLVLLIAFSLVVLLIPAYARSVADAALTDQFRAAESISNGRIPEKWAAQINRSLAYKRMAPALLPEASGTKQSLQKLDRLMQYFNKSPFFENAESRELLLNQFKETRQRWLKMTWEEIGKD
jgi:hypothetical protein